MEHLQTYTQKVHDNPSHHHLICLQEYAHLYWGFSQPEIYYLP